MMIATVLLVGAWCSAFLGAALIALTSRTHRIAVRYNPSRSPGRRGNATFGGLLLLLTIALAVLRDGVGIGLLLGPLLIAGGIATVIALLAVRPSALHFIGALVLTKQHDRRG